MKPHASSQRFPTVHWIWKGGISFTYEVHPRIVVKVPESEQENRERFKQELAIYRTFSQNGPCPYIIQYYHLSDDGIFLEYMRDGSLFYRIQQNQIRDEKTNLAAKVKKLEPFLLRLQWMNHLTQAVAYLESLNLAHGDLRPENILLDRNRLKLSDFDCTAEFGNHHEACIAPYGRFLNCQEGDLGACGSAGSLGPRTEQFALGSVFYLINYGFEVYGDRCLFEDPHEHGLKVVELLQDMVFPELKGGPIDDIIDKCWHNGYATIAELGTFTERLFNEENDREHASEFTDSEDQSHTVEDDLSKKTLCQELEKDGLLRLLCSGDPEELGFKLEWYRHAS